MNTQTMMAATARTELTNPHPEGKVLDPLYARVLVLQADGHTVVFVTIDVTAIGGRAISDGILPDGGEELVPALREYLQQKWNIPAEGVVVNASHTHPAGQLLCDDTEQLRRITVACNEALGRLVPARIGFGKAKLPPVAMNRNLKLKEGKDYAIRHTNPTPADCRVEAVRPIDNEIGLIRVDRADGTPLALVYNFGCHPLFGDSYGSLTANFPGEISMTLEQLLGDGVTAFFLQGCAGDVIDRGFKDFLHPRDVKTPAKLIALQIIPAAAAIETTSEAIIRCAVATLQLPRRTDITEKTTGLRRRQQELLEQLHYCPLNFKNFLLLLLHYRLEPDYPLTDAFQYLQADADGNDGWREMDRLNRMNLEKYLRNIAAMEELSQIQDDLATLEKHQRLNAASGETTIATEIQVIRINNAVLATSAAELLTRIGLNLKKMSPFSSTLVAGYTNGYLHYGPPAALYDRGGYEVTECLLGREWQQLFESAAAQLFKQVCDQTK